MQWLYSLSIRLFVWGVYLAQPFHPKAKKWVQGRKKIWQHLPEIPKNSEVIWFHCASLGEFDQGLPLMNKIKEKKPTCFLFVTFFSPSGFENYNKRKHQVDFACYLPADYQKNAERLLDHFRPKQAFFVKYEFWCKIILEARKRKIEVYSVCAIFRPEHRFFKWYGSYFRHCLRQMNRFFVQNKESITLLKGIGIEQVTRVGDMRFDRVLENKKQVEKDPVVESFLAGEKAFIIGSSWPVDEQFLTAFVLKYSQTAKVIIAPHQIDEAHLREIEKRFDKQVVRYAAYGEQRKENILLIDSIGKLANLYQYGSFAYIGGGFTGSLHNILEPAVFGLPVLFGPKHKRFPEAQLFLDEGVGFQVENTLQLDQAFLEIQAKDWSSRLDQLVQSQAGAAEKIIKTINLS